MSQFSSFAARPDQIDAKIEHLQFAYKLSLARKERTWQQMGIGPGDSILDVGCGVGMDTIPFGQQVGATGRVVGIDLDEQAIAEAERRALAAGMRDWVHHRCADAAAIPYPDGSFDICHAERLFLHLSDPEPVLTEMIRVLKPGGRIVLVDGDGATGSIDCPDSELERRITPFWNALHKNPYAGRQFFRLLKQHRMVNISINIDVYTTHDYAVARFSQKSDDVEAAALAAGAVTQADVDRFHQILEELNAKSTFFASTNILTVIGQKP